SPEGQTIWYVSRERGPASLYAVSASGGAPRRVITNGAPDPTEPDWSPDGRWIAFTSLAGGFQICIVRAQGGDAIVIAPGEDPSWAPNSRALIFCHGPDHSRSEEHTSELQSRFDLVCRLLLEKKNNTRTFLSI